MVSSDFHCVDIDLPKKPAEVGTVRRMFLDPSASHLIISTTLGENYYLHTQSRQPKSLSRLRGIGIESIAWNPSTPTASTREILVGAVDGNIYEDYIEPTGEFYRSQEKYLKGVYKVADEPIAGLRVDLLSGKPDARQVLVATPNKLLRFGGRVGRHGQEGSGSIFAKLFETEVPTLHELGPSTNASMAALAVAPDPPEPQSGEDVASDRNYAWLTDRGILYGNLQTRDPQSGIGGTFFNSTKVISKASILTSKVRDRRKPADDSNSGMVLSQWHVLCLVEGRVMAIQRLNQRVIYDQSVPMHGGSVLCLLTDQKQNTYWLFTTQNIFEIILTDEDRDVWKIFLEDEQFSLASQYAKLPSQKDIVATASGDYLISKGRYHEAANVYGKSSRPFEQVALIFIDHGERDALRRYLLTKIASYPKTSIMQRTMIASWLVEIFMSKLNFLDDSITTKAQSTEYTNRTEPNNDMAAVRKEYEEYLVKHKGDLDHTTTYEIISSHGRERELLFYATTINDFNYVLSYWVQREQWQASLDILKRQTSPKIFYKYSSVLMAHAPTDFVDILMRHAEFNPLKFIPALLNYNSLNPDIPLAQNQAVRYLHFCISNLDAAPPAIHNTLISIYASHSSPSEDALLSYISNNSVLNPLPYDADFAFRLCIQHLRVQSAVHIYTSVGSYASAVDLALKHNEIDLASFVADRPATTDLALRKRLWLAVAKKVISQQGMGSIKTAIDFLKRCDLLKIEDLIPLFPDFVVIDDFKDQICVALEGYSRSINSLESEMDASAATAQSIKSDIRNLDHRYAIVEPGERCRSCELPLRSRQFFVFPSCQHGFHSDCLGKRVLEGSGITVKGRIRELQAQIARGGRREREGKELDALVAGQCVLCGDLAIKSIDEPFVSEADDDTQWSV